jgi:hydroxymethylpyrimidine/phosphomethylpyrimidine kinase
MKSALTIAGSDSGGGAGIQADLKTFSAYGIHGTTAVTAITAQNTMGVQGTFALPGEFVRRQIESVLDDIGADAVKTGMLPNPEIVEIVASSIRRFGIDRLVVDPVMIAQSGDSLSSAEAALPLRELLLPLALLVTPNIPEAEAMTGMKIDDLEDMKSAAAVIHDIGVRNVLIKGGHFEGDNAGCDLFSDGCDSFFLRPVRTTDKRDIHGTGCSLSAAIAAGLAKGMSLVRSVEAAKEFITRAIDSAYPIGGGVMPVNPLHLTDDADSKELDSK